MKMTDVRDIQIRIRAMYAPEVLSAEILVDIVHILFEYVESDLHNQPERSKREDLIEQLQEELIERSRLNVEIIKAQLGCGALNTMET